MWMDSLENWKIDRFQDRCCNLTESSERSADYTSFIENIQGRDISNCKHVALQFVLLIMLELGCMLFDVECFMYLASSGFDFLCTLFAIVPRVDFVIFA